MAELLALAQQLAGRLTAGPILQESSLSALSLARAGFAFEEMGWNDYSREWLRQQLGNYQLQSPMAWGAARVALEINELNRREFRHVAVHAPPRREVIEIVHGACDFIVSRADRTEDGLLLPHARSESVTAESLFYSCPLLAAGGMLCNDDRFVDEAARQLFGYAGHAHDAVTHLFFRAWIPVERSCDEVLDARGNGFALNAIVDTLEYLPFEHRRRRAIQMILTYAAAGLDAHQNAEGSWHEVMDDDTSRVDASATALITAALARGLRLGSVSEDHRDNALRGWDAVQAKVDDADAACVLLAAAAIHELRIED